MDWVGSCGVGAGGAVSICSFSRISESIIKTCAGVGSWPCSVTSIGSSFSRRVIWLVLVGAESKGCRSGGSGCSWVGVVGVFCSVCECGTVCARGGDFIWTGVSYGVLCTGSAKGFSVGSGKGGTWGVVILAIVILGVGSKFGILAGPIGFGFGIVLDVGCGAEGLESGASPGSGLGICLGVGLFPGILVWWGLIELVLCLGTLPW